MEGWGAALGAVLTPGVGAAISPIPVIAVLLTLSSPRGRVSGRSFLLGYAVVVVVITAAALSLATGADVAEDHTPSVVASLVQLAVGVLFAYLAWSNWRKRPQAGIEPTMPGWMRSLSTASTGTAFRIGLIVSLTNAKNLSLAVSAMAAVAQAGPPAAAAVTAGVVFAVFSCAGIIIPLLYSRLRPAQADARLGAIRDYLVSHNAVIMAVLFAVLGANSLGKAITQLL